MAFSSPEMPCTPILELNGQRKRFHVPFGLKPLLDIMIRKVLRDQPENIYEYFACFLEARVREKGGKEDEKEEEKYQRKSWQVHRWSWEGKSTLPDEELSEFIQMFKTSIDDAHRYATVIQTVYRGHLAREKVKELRISKGEVVEPFTPRNTMEEAQRGVSELQQENFNEEEDEEDEAPETEVGSNEYDDYGEDQFVRDEEDYTETYEQKDSEEEFETEMETISEMDESAEEMEMVIRKSARTNSKYDMDKLTDKDDAKESKEEGG